MDVAGIDETQPFLDGDVPSTRQRAPRSRRCIRHLVIGMERGEMHRHVDAEVVGDPGAFGGDLRVADLLEVGVDLPAGDSGQSCVLRIGHR